MFSPVGTSDNGLAFDTERLPEAIMKSATVAGGVGIGVVGVLLASSLFTRPPAGAVGTIEHGDYDPLTTRPSDEGDVGQVMYLRYCVGCHGENGDGQGPAAVFLDPKPRDFSKGIYKFTSTPANSPPLDADLLRTITNGLHGTSMPPWPLIPLTEREALVRYIRAFYKEWHFRGPETPVSVFQNPFDVESVEGLEEAIDKGREVYHKQATCWVCHASYLGREDLEALTGGPARPDLDKPLAKPDLWGESILPPEFRTHDLKSVRTLKDLYQVIAAGIGGTAMPTWAGALEPDQLWALTLYVDSLRPDSIVKQMMEKIREGE